MFVWVAMVTFGAVLVETLLIYPNVFADIPGSLDGAMAFFSVTGPADVFPPLGAATGSAGVATLALWWRDRSVRPFAAAAEKASTLDMPLHLRLDRELDEQLRRGRR